MTSPSRHTRVAMLVDTARLGEWSIESFERGEAAVSGSDGTALWLAEALARRGVAVTLGLSRLPVDPRPHHVRVPEPAALLDRVGPGDVVLVVHGVTMGDPRRFLERAEERGAAVVVWGQNSPGPELEALYERSAAVRRFACVSNVQCDALRDKRLFAKTAVVYNALVADVWSREARPANRREVCFLGSMTASKGFHLLAQAWPRVRAEVPDATLRVFGSAHLYDRSRPLGPLGVGEPDYELRHLVPVLGDTREAARDLGVFFHGLSTPRETAAAASGAALGVVNPSFMSTETFCVAAVELQALGLPVVGARAGGLLETVVHGQTGLLVRERDSLEASIVSLLRDESRRARMADAARRHAERFVPDAVLPEWIALLDSVARGVPPSSPPFLGHPHERDAYLRQCVQLARKAPLLGPRLPTLAEAKAGVRRVRSALGGLRG